MTRSPTVLAPTLMLPVWLGAVPASSMEPPMHAPATMTEERLVPQAPVGHRQPRASDIPAERQKTAADEEQERRDRELDKKLRICRGC